jgi:hypothetical protein
MAIDIGVGAWFWTGHLAALQLFVRIKTDVKFWKNFSRRNSYPETDRSFSKKFFP